MVELRLGLRAKLRLSVNHYVCCPGFVNYKKKINRQHQRRFADIETIMIYRNFDIFLDEIDTIRYGQYRLDILLHHYSQHALTRSQLVVVCRPQPSNSPATVNTVT